jgi:RsiW-degrading membrane proteinase PrsW (M82 family)
MIQNAAPTRSQLMPLLTKYKELPSKSQLIPALLTIVVIMLLFAFSGYNKPIVIRRGDNPAHWFYTSQYILVLGVFLVFLSLQFLYSLAGKAKSWMGLIGVMLFTMAFMQFGGFDLLYPIFYDLLAGGTPARTDTLGVSLWKHFVGTGFLEELTKAIPLLLLVLFASKLSPEQQRKFGIEEPLDGILLGAASAGGFVLIETVGQYVPRYLVGFWVDLATSVLHVPPPKTIGELAKLIGIGSGLAGTAPGLELLIPRGLRACFGHMAYSGYFGYFIGLAVLKPEKRWRILGIGFLSASFVHALWDTIPGDLVKISIAVLCYAILTAAILKARELSPNRMTLGPSILLGYSAQQAPAAAYPTPVAYPMPPQQQQPVPPTAHYAMAGGANLALPGGGSVPMQAMVPVSPMAGMAIPARILRIGFRQMTLVGGTRITEEQAPGLQPQTPGGPVAQVVQNPNDPSVLGLNNLSRSAWEAVSPSGNRHTIQPFQTMRLSPGTRIDFGTVDGEVA